MGTVTKCADQVSSRWNIIKKELVTLFDWGIEAVYAYIPSSCVLPLSPFYLPQSKEGTKAADPNIPLINEHFIYM